MSNNQESLEVRTNGEANEDVYEEYGGHYAEYDGKTSRDKNAQFNVRSVLEKTWKRKWWLIGLAFVLIIVAIAIGLGIHFSPENPLTKISCTSAVTTTPYPSATNSPSTNCTTPNPETVVLILSTYLPSNVPMLIGLNGKTDFIFPWTLIFIKLSSGEVDDDLSFTYDPKTEVRASCAASFDGEMFVLGGWNLPRQVILNNLPTIFAIKFLLIISGIKKLFEMSKVQNCKLASVGQLPFDFLGGACKAFSFGIMLCFAINAKQECYS